MGPVAVVGVGLRLPGGVRDMETFADLLWGRVDAVHPVPTERWPAAVVADPDLAARMGQGAFLDRLDLFDAEFFGISPREAAALDPQQRLLLEVTWEALENACINPRHLAGTQTGVFMGVGPSDYGRELLSQTAEVGPYSVSGMTYGTAVGRLSYFFDLLGPSLAIDTACSSSLVALHAAAQALQQGDCDTALTGGVNVILAPEMSVSFAKAKMLAPDGRCRSFSADARGYVRGEGCVVLVLRRLAEAQASGDRIFGLIRGSAVNQDGRSQSLTAPRRSSQEAVIKAALAKAGVQPHEIGFVEAHGSGTPLGDPVEAEALGNVLCQGRERDQRLAIGSLKTNIGHLEIAGGAAGLVKILLAFAHDSIPPNLHFSSGNPLIDWDQLQIEVLTTARAWTRNTTARLAGVSAFGFGGTNAHVIVEEPPVRQERPRSGPAVAILPISARSPSALADLAKRYSSALRDDVDLDAFCQCAALGRAHFARRRAVVGATPAEMRAQLELVSRGEDAGSTGLRGAPAFRLRIADQHCRDTAAIAALKVASPTFARLFDVKRAAVDSRSPPLSADAFALTLAVTSLLVSFGLDAARTRMERPETAEGLEICAALALEHGLSFEGPEDAPANKPVLTLVISGEAGTDAWRALLCDIARLYGAGAEIDWAAIYRNHPPLRITLPTYPFSRKRHWAPQVRAFAQEPDGTPIVDRPSMILDLIATAPAADRFDLLIEHIRETLKPFQDARPDPLPLKLGFSGSGIDPTSVEIRRCLERSLGRNLSPTVLLNHPNLHAFATYLLAEWVRPDPPSPEPSGRSLFEDKLQSRLRARLAKLS